MLGICVHRPSFEKLVDMLSSYYKKLHKLHDISADAYEISDQESAGESDGADVWPLSFSVWCSQFEQTRCRRE